MCSLHMVRGKRVVFIGLFPSTYRAVTIDLGWTSGWKKVISFVEVVWNK